MLTLPILHPGLLAALAVAGHGARILIADGNYPVAGGAPAGAARIHLNLCPGMVGVLDVLDVLRLVIPIEAATVLVPADGAAQEIHAEFRRRLPEDLIMEGLVRADFYTRARSEDTTVVIATGEQRRFANLLLTVGVVRPARTDPPSVGT